MSAAPGQWNAIETGIWHFIDMHGQRRDFALTGERAARRAEQAQLMARNGTS